MLYASLSASAREHGDHPALILDDAVVTYAELAPVIGGLCETFAPLRGKNVGVVLPLSPQLLCALAALDYVGATAFLLDPQAKPPVALDETIRALPATPHRPLPNSPVGGKLVLSTSGTTGAPKGVVHSWDNLGKKLKVRQNLVGHRWLFTYQVTLFAGIQVLLQAIVNAGCIVAVSRPTMPEYFAAMQRHGVDYVASTPTFWKKMLLAIDRAELAGLPLKQITFGAEILTEELLRQLRSVFPQTKLSQIFATTETGVCFSVNDGHAGFPESYLAAPPPGVRLKVENGELFVQSEARMERYADGSTRADDWIATGDLVEVRDGRVYFKGRKTDLINVAGSKVSPVEVEDVIAAVPGVGHVRVFGHANPVTGQIVAAEVLPVAGKDRAALENSIHQTCAQRLPPHKRPRIIRFVESIATAPSGKIQRRSEVNA